MKAFVKNAIVVSAFALTANSWGYPVHDFIDSFYTRTGSDKAGKYIAIHTQNNAQNNVDVFSLTKSFAEEGNSAGDNYSIFLAALQNDFNDRLFKEVKFWRYNDSSWLWIGFNLRDSLPHPAGEQSSKNSVTENGVTKPSSNGSKQVNVSEPSSIALVCSGLLGLLWTRRRDKQKLNVVVEDAAGQS